MKYAIDFFEISLDHHHAQLQKKTHIPSRQILKDQAESHFSAFKKAGISNLGQLFSLIHNKKAKAELLKDSSISEEYLTILLRELKSIQAQPVKLSEFEWIDQQAIAKLAAAGITNTKTLYETLGLANERKTCADEIQIEERTLLDLLKLSDLVRIQWVKASFARVLFLAGFDTVKKVAMADAEDLYVKICQINDQLNLYKGTIGRHDMKLCIEAALSIPAEIEV